MRKLTVMLVAMALGTAIAWGQGWAPHGPIDRKSVV